MDIYKTENASDFEKFVAYSLNGHEGIGVHVAKERCVWTGQLPTINRTECKNKKLYIGSGKYLGGTIVDMVGDVTLCITTYYISDYAPKLVDSFAKYLEEKGIEITRDENDILANGKKVVSWARATSINGWTQSFIHFSVGKMNLKLVKAICTKPMVKKPGSLAELGVTTEDVLERLNFDIKE